MDFLPMVFMEFVFPPIFQNRPTCVMNIYIHP